MEFDPIIIVSIASILVMVYCLYLVISLKKSVPGGMVGNKWSFLTGLVVLFTLGYLTAPFFGRLPENVLRLIVSFIFFFGAIYVVITVKLIYRVIQELAE